MNDGDDVAEVCGHFEDDEGIVDGVAVNCFSRFCVHWKQIDDSGYFRTPSQLIVYIR